jgi:transcriptional regulator
VIGGHRYLVDMYRPAAFDVAELDVMLDMVDEASFGHLVTFGPDGFASTGLPFVVDRDGGPCGRLRGHLARANPHWRTIDDAPTLVIVPLADGYVSPAWYPSKTEHGRVVPTWNYELVHVHGTVRVHDDPEWVRTLVTDLTDRHESARSGPPEPWRVTDAPADNNDGQLRAIVGVEVEISSIEAKRKLSQNRPEGDHTGVATALAGSDRPGDHEVADAMRRNRSAAL